MNSSRKLFTPLICALPGFILLFQVTFGGTNKDRPARIALFEWKQFDVNNINCTIANDGAFADYRKTGQSGIEWPKGSGKTAVFTAGIWIAGKKALTDSIYTAVADYQTEFQPGPILSPYSGDVSVAADPNDPRYRIYKIEPSDSVGGVNPDYDEWPADLGAPLDEYGRPRFLGDQQLFVVFNDLDTAAHRITGTTQPMGVEAQALFWGLEGEGLLDDVLFMQWRIINKSVFQYNNVFVTLFADIDLGDASDDLPGCDSTLSLGYVYNADDYDGSSAGYGYEPAAAGLVLLKGPHVQSSYEDSSLIDGRWVRGLKSLPLTSAVMYRGGDPRFSDPPLGSTGFPRVAYDYMKGLNGTVGAPFINPLTGRPSGFVFSGDPVTQEGWLPQQSGVLQGDMRILVSSGPVTLAPFETQVVAGAIILARSQDRLSSVARLKFLALEVSSRFYEGRSRIFRADPSVRVNFETKSQTRLVIRAETEDVMRAWAELYRTDGLLLETLDLYDDGMHGDENPTDGIFGGEVVVSPSPMLLRMDLRLELANGDTVRIPSAVARITTLGPINTRDLEVVSDHINEDRVINPSEHVQISFSLQNTTSENLGRIVVTDNRAFYYAVAVTADSLPSDSTVRVIGSLPLVVPENAPIGIALPIEVFIYEERWGNRWIDTLWYVVEPFAFPPIEKLTTHVGGPATGAFGVRLVDPLSWNDDEYQIRVHSSRRFSLIDATTGATVLQQHDFPDYLATNIPVTDGFKVTAGNLEYYFDGEILGVFEVRGPDGRVVDRDPRQPSTDPGLNVLTEPNSTSEWSVTSWPPQSRSRFQLNAGEYNSLGRSDFEIRFTETGSEYYTGNEQFSMLQKARYRVPFEIWDIGETPDEAGDDKRLSVRILDLDSNGVWTIARDSTLSEPIFSTVIPPYAEPLPDPGPPASRAHFRIGNLVFYEGPALSFAPPALGTVVRVHISRTPTVNDMYSFNPVRLSPVESTREIPQTFALFQNYPNPFNPTTNIRYELPQQSNVRLIIFNILGQHVATLVNEVQQAGRYTVAWNGISNLGRAASSGVYFYLLQAGDFIQTRKMLHIK